MKSKIFNKKLYSIIQYLLGLILFFPILLYVSPTRGVGIYLYTALAPIFALLYLSFGIEKKNLYPAIAFTVITLCYGCFFTLIKSDIEPFLFSCNMVTSLIISAVLIKNPQAAEFGAKFTLTFLFGWYIYCLLTIGYTPLDANNYLYGLSRNHVSFLFLVAVILYYSIQIYSRKKVSILPAIMLTIASVQLYGRSGIFLSLCIFFLMLFYWWRQRGSNLSFLFVFTLFSAFFLFSYRESILSIVELANLSDRGVESARWSMLSGYLSNVDFSSFLIGGDLSKVKLIQYYEGNPHNSFISGHSKVGFFFIIFIFLIFIVLFSCIALRPSERKLHLIALYFILLVRASVDTLFFYSIFDIFIFYLVYLVFYDDKSKLLTVRSYQRIN